MPHRLSRRAQDDLDDIWFYLARESRSEAVADRTVATLTERFYLLAQHPKLGRARDDNLGAGRRAFPVGNYVIVYRIVGANVRILRVLHKRRDLNAIFGGD